MFFLDLVGEVFDSRAFSTKDWTFSKVFRSTQAACRATSFVTSVFPSLEDAMNKHAAGKTCGPVVSAYAEPGLVR